MVLDRDPDEPELWSFGHVIDGAVGKRGRLRHDPSTHETTLTSGHGGGLYTTAALIVHLACLRTEGVPSSFVYDVATRRIETGRLLAYVGVEDGVGPVTLADHAVPVTRRR